MKGRWHSDANETLEFYPNFFSSFWKRLGWLNPYLFLCAKCKFHFLAMTFHSEKKTRLSRTAIAHSRTYTDKADKLPVGEKAFVFF